MSEVFTVTMLTVMQDRFHEWLRQDGLDMQRIGGDDEHPQYVVVIPPGSWRAEGLRQGPA